MTDTDQNELTQYRQSKVLIMTFIRPVKDGLCSVSVGLVSVSRKDRKKTDIVFKVDWKEFFLICHTIFEEVGCFAKNYWTINNSYSIDNFSH
jgi:hypothetical protein